MRHDEERYLNDEDDNDLWDDELEIDSDYVPLRSDYDRDQSFESENRYSADDSNDGQNVSETISNGYESEHSQSGRLQEKSDEPEDYYSDPEPESKEKPKRRGLFGKRASDEEEEDNDYFDSDEDPAPVVKKPRAPKLDPEDPDYWIEEDESPISSIISKPRKKWKWMLAAALTFIAMIIFVWIWFFRPYTDNAVKYGYIINMERRGSLIKTFEGTMIPYKELGDPDPFYFKEVKFSVPTDSLAAVMKRMMLGCIPVRVEYEIYHTPLPWKGEEKMIILKADTADPRKILPPEYQ